MITRNAEKADSLSRKNIRVTDILAKSREKIAHKQTRRDKGDSIDYGTDSKRKSNSQSYLGDVEDMRAVIQSCQSCLERISQFTTKKPRPTPAQKEDKSTQTLNKPFLIDLIEQRVNQLCRQNRKMSKMLLDKESEILDRQGEISEMEEKFTNILYTIGQELAYLKAVKQDLEELKQNSLADGDTPSYVKAIMMERTK